VIVSVRTVSPPSPSARRGIPIGDRLRELVRYRELLRNLVIRDLKARYRNSVLGFFWSLLNPLGMMLVFTFVFTVLTPNTQMPRYPIFFLCGFLPWQFFSVGVMTSLYSIVGNSTLVNKVYFSREVLPISTVLANLVNFLLAMVVLFGALFVTRTPLSPYIWLLPVVIAVQTCFVLGMAFFLSTLNVFYRDTAMIMEVVMLAWFFLTPIFYPITVLPSSYEVFGITLNLQRLMYILNPMASLIQYYRDLLYLSTRTNLDFFLRTAVTALVILVLGYAFFLHFSRRFGEEV
jgi:homopolymeric O-antigen transport system permease protein